MIALMRFKYFIFALIFISAFMAGRYFHKPQEVVYQQDVKPVETVILKQVDPNDYADLINRAKAPIQIDRKFDGQQLTIVATDTYKLKKVVDSIHLQKPRNFAFAGLGVDNVLRVQYTAGYLRQVYFDGFYCGGYVSFSNASFNSVNVIAGYSF